MKKSKYLTVILLFAFVSIGHSQGKDNTTFLVTEVGLESVIHLRNSEFLQKGVGLALNLGFDKKVNDKIGLGMHLFANTWKYGARVRISKFNEERKVFDVSIGTALHNLNNLPINIEASYYFKKDIGIYTRLEMSKEDYHTEGAFNPYSINFGLKVNSPEVFEIATAAAVIIVGLAILTISNRN